MKSDVKMMQEVLPNGRITTSHIRWMSIIVLLALFVYMFRADRAYDVQLDKYIKMCNDGVITEASFNVLVMGLEKFNEYIIYVFLLASFAPKVFQKYIENKSIPTTPTVSQ